MSEQKRPTPADLDRVAEWLGYPWSVGQFHPLNTPVLLRSSRVASDWDVTGAIFDKLCADGLAVIVEWMNGRCTIQLAGKWWVADMNQHAAALACAVKYTESKP